MPSARGSCSTTLMTCEPNATRIGLAGVNGRPPNNWPATHSVTPPPDCT